MRDGDSRGRLLASVDSARVRLARVKRRLPEIYLVLGLMVTGLLCFITAPFFAPDEPDQALRAISLSHGELLAHLGPSGEAGAEVDAGGVRAMDGMDDIRMAWERRAPDFLNRPYGPVRENDQRPLNGIGWARQRVFVTFGNTAGYPPVLYFPAMAGWRVGEAAGLTIFQSLRLARGFCALTAVGLGWLALRLCAGSGWMLLPFLLLPSTLFLNASCSQDAVLLAVAGLLAAMLSRPLAGGREFTELELAVVAGLLALCGTARPPYLGMAVVLFLPGLELRVRGWREWLAPTVAFVGVAAVCGMWRHLVAPLGLEHSDEARPELQAVFLRGHPAAAAAAIAKGTLAAAGDFARRGLYVVGWNDLLPHYGAGAALALCLGVMVLFAPRIPLRNWGGRGLLGLAVATPLLGISLAEYVIWTPPGGHTVYGIQPRYWLPVMPLATMLLQGILKRFWGGAGRNWLVLGAVGMFGVLACTLPWTAAHAFYREGIVRVLALNLQ